MKMDWRHGALFAGGLAIGAAVVWVDHMPHGAVASAPGARTATSAPAPAVGPVAQRATARPASTAELATRAMGAASTPAAAVAAASLPAVPCPSQPVAHASGPKDGHFEVQQDLSGDRASDAGAFIVIGKEAAAGGRVRDAEVAFLMSCRVAQKFAGAQSVESADARYQLARHYANLALQGRARPGVNRDELLQRAQALYAASVQTYASTVGPAHEKSRYATQGLTTVQQALGGKAPTPPVVVAQAPAASAAPPRAAAVAPTAPAVVAQVPQAEQKKPAPFPVAPSVPAVASKPAPQEAPAVTVARRPSPAAPAAPAVVAQAIAPAPMPTRTAPPEAAPARATAAPVPRAVPTAPTVVAEAAPRFVAPKPVAPPAVVANPVRPQLQPQPPDAVAQAEPSTRSFDAQPAFAEPRVRPSFDCARARSVPEKLICSDEQLARLDRELGQLHAKVKSVTNDPVRFRRENEAQWRMREATCRDRSCLRWWYAQRREQLLDDLEDARSGETAQR